MIAISFGGKVKSLNFFLSLGNKIFNCGKSKVKRTDVIAPPAGQSVEQLNVFCWTLNINIIRHHGPYVCNAAFILYSQGRSRRSEDRSKQEPPECADMLAAVFV